MRQLGHTEGQDFIVDSVVYNADKPDEAAREMVRHHVDLILATTQGDIVLAAKRATRDIPIVFVVAGDPVANGIVASMSRPGGNATGLTSLNASADAKRLELLKEAMPALRRVALLASQGDPATIASPAPLAMQHDRSALSLRYRASKISTIWRAR
jgi:putative tryptophan/tyrosine transport system substrate-binding protein